MTYAVLLCNEGAKRPRHELARVRDVILAVCPVAAEPVPLIDNPATACAHDGVRGDGARRRPVVVLIAAVVVLTAVTLRLARRGAAG